MLMAGLDANIQKFFGSFFQKRTESTSFLKKRSKKLLIIKADNHGA
jgi:hypothetical protein